jgi:hypothetical protein
MEQALGAGQAVANLGKTAAEAEATVAKSGGKNA